MVFSFLNCTPFIHIIMIIIMKVNSHFHQFHLLASYLLPPIIYFCPAITFGHCKACIHVLRLGRFLQAVVEERPTEDGVACGSGFGMWGGEKGLVTPVEINWEEQIFNKESVQVFENSGAKPTPRSTYRLRYAVIACACDVY